MLHNPMTGGQEWYHGTPHDFERFRQPQSDHDKAWNTALGHHFTADHETAEDFASGVHGADAPVWTGRVVHAHLHIDSPKVYGSEKEMFRHAMAVPHQKGEYQHDAYLRWLRENGHDGVVYGNEVEGPYLHPCAIALHPDDIEITQHHLITKRCKDNPESLYAEGARRPQPGDVIVADVSGWDEAEPRGEVHRLGGYQDGSRRLPDGSETGGLGVTQCGIEQATRGHGWYALDPDNEYQQRNVSSGKWPRCPRCFAKQAGVLDTWKPLQRLFAPTKTTLDPRLFDADRMMRAAVRTTLMDKMVGFLRHNGWLTDWSSWLRMYLAGSEASYWWGNNDFDILVGIEYDRFRAAFGSDQSNDEITQAFNVAFNHQWNDENWHPPFDPDDEWHLTGYVNHDSWDIRRIKPYAAYEVISQQWFVQPISEPEGHKFDETFFYLAEGYAAQIRSALKMPEPVRTKRLTRLWHFLHADRSRAFGPHGSGAFDRGNAVEKYLDQAPSGDGKSLWQAMVDARFQVAKKGSMEYISTNDPWSGYEAGKGKDRQRSAPQGGAGGRASNQDPAQPVEGDDAGQVAAGRWSQANPAPLVPHPALKKDLRGLHPNIVKKFEQVVANLQVGQRHPQTHPLAGKLKGWDSSPLGYNHRVIHRYIPEGLEVGWAGAHENDDVPNKRLGSVWNDQEDCPACSGSGEQGTGHECYKCDGTGLADEYDPNIDNANPENGLLVGRDDSKGIKPVEGKKATWIGDHIPEEPTLYWRAPNMRWEVHIKNHMPSRDFRENYGVKPKQEVWLHENDTANPHAKPAKAEFRDGALHQVSFGFSTKPPPHVMKHVHRAQEHVDANAANHEDLYGQMADQDDIASDLARVPKDMADEQRGHEMFKRLIEHADDDDEGHTAAVRTLTKPIGVDDELPSGIMVHLVPPGEHIEPLLSDEGEHADVMHMTLAYLGKIADHSEEQLRNLPEVVQAWAEGQQPIDAKIQGVGTFVNTDNPNENERHVLWATADIPGGPAMHVSLVDYLRQHGYKPYDNHGWLPHITLGYSKHHYRFLPKLEEKKPWPIREVWLAIGPRWESFPLGT